MTGLILSMLRARWAQAVTLFLLGAIAVAAAVAGPVANEATEAAAARVEVANAPVRERTIAISWSTDPTGSGAAADFNAVVRAVSLPGFEVVRAGEITAFGPGVDASSARRTIGTQVVFRDGLCQHVTIQSGRCLVGTDEILVGAETARRVGLAAGDIATIQAAAPALPDGTVPPDGDPVRLTVVGIYRPTDADEDYWVGRDYFRVTAGGARAEPVFTTAASMHRIPHTIGSSHVDVVIPPHVLTAQRLQDIEQEIDGIRQALASVNTVSSTALPALAERVRTSRDLASQLGPVAFLPLAAISVFVIYLAVGYGAFGRREEIGVVTLRGVAARWRWLLASGETVLPILAAAPVGYVLGQLWVAEVARVRLGSGEGANLSSGSARYAAVAVALTVGVALLGQRRVLREPVVELLRGVPRTAPVWQALTAEILVGALAIVASVQLRLSSQGLRGLGMLVPGLVILFVALVAARAFVQLAGLVGRWAVPRGLLGMGLAAVQLARRPGSRRLFALLAVGAALFAFVAAGIDVSSRARDERATVTTGADRVLRVSANADPRRILSATRELDPAGEWAMAVSTLEPFTPDEPPVLAVDMPRLPAVASWRQEFGADPATVAAALAMPQPGQPGYLAPLIFQGTELELEVDVLPLSTGEYVPHDVEFVFTHIADGTRVTARFPILQPGRQTVRAVQPRCTDGCRLSWFTISTVRAGPTFVFHSLRQLDPVGYVVSPDDFANEDRWGGNANVLLRVIGSSLSVPTVRMLDNRPMIVSALAAATPAPVATVGQGEVTQIASYSEQYVDSEAVVGLAMLPRLGPRGVLVDLGYLEQTIVGTPAPGIHEIWLGPAAPPDAADRFRRLGLTIDEETAVAAVRDALARQGPALALQFFDIAAGVGVLVALGGLGLVAAVERRSRAADLRALRAQGLRRRTAGRAAQWGYLSMVVLAAGAGLAGAAAAWAAAGDQLPIFTDSSSVLAPPRWPAWQAVVEPWLLATAAMALAALVAGWSLRRAVRRSGGNGR